MRPWWRVPWVPPDPVHRPQRRRVRGQPDANGGKGRRAVLPAMDGDPTRPLPGSWSPAGGRPRTCAPGPGGGKSWVRTGSSGRLTLPAVGTGDRSSSGGAWEGVLLASRRRLSTEPGQPAFHHTRAGAPLHQPTTRACLRQEGIPAAGESSPHVAVPELDLHASWSKEIPSASRMLDFPTSFRPMGAVRLTNRILARPPEARGVSRLDDRVPCHVPRGRVVQGGKVWHTSGWGPGVLLSRPGGALPSN